ncbi:hypothetical protein V2J09_020943 [Rumex salicifolius]
MIIICNGDKNINGVRSSIISLCLLMNQNCKPNNLTPKLEWQKLPI